MRSDHPQTVPCPHPVEWPPVLRATVGTLLRRLFHRIDCGEILLQTPSGRGVVISGMRGEEQAHIRIHGWKCLLRLLIGGDLGFAEGFLAGEW